MNSLFPSVCVVCMTVLAVVYLQNQVDDFRIDNFSAGPGSLPIEVLKKAQGEFLNYEDRGMSVFEMSHRDQNGPVQNMILRIVDQLRKMLDVPSNYYILHMHGGANAQFSALPLNLIGDNDEDKVAVYVVTGYWSNRAADEAANVLGDPSRVIKIDGVKDGALVAPSDWNIPANAAYVHICASETIDGYEFLVDPDVITVDGRVIPLTADFTSTLLSRPVQVEKYGVIFASGGKNLGPSGHTAVIVREDLTWNSKSTTPGVLSWRKGYDSKPVPGVFNTPATWNIYMHGLVLEHMEAHGGLPYYEQRSIRRANDIYAIIDSSNGFYYNQVANKDHRSRMNIPLTIGNGDTRRKDLEEKFVQESMAQNMAQLFGHPVSGGLRVTLYNGISDESIERLKVFMAEFLKANAF